MNALVYTRYGGPEVLGFAEVEKPVPGAGQVLIRVAAASLNASDYRLMRATPFLVRLDNGLFRPKKRQILGSDFAGTVESVGSGVGAFVPGDAVFGSSFHHGLGAFAEYICVRQDALGHKPGNVTFAEAAAIPLAGITALQAVRDRAQVRSGQSVLIHGAGGGVGSALVQLAQARGAVVTAVCGPGSVGLIASLGVARIVNYAQEDFSAGADRYDVIFGVNGYRSLAVYKRSLKRGGTYVMIGGDSAQIFQALLAGRLWYMFGGKKFGILTLDKRRIAEDLGELEAMLASGKMKAAIDRVFPFEGANAAFRYVEEGHVRGKVILAMPQGPRTRTSVTK